jgi:glycosyltransferase involved in cell wall biosynthesis
VTSRRKYKIALVANTTWNIYNFRLNVIRKLIEEGHEVIVMAPVDEYISYQWKIPGVQHYPIHQLRRDSINPVKDIQLMSELRQLYRKHKPDLVVHYTVKPNIYGGIAAYLTGIPSLAVVTGLGYAFIHNGFVKYATKALYKVATRYHEKVIFENMDDKQLFVDERLLPEGKGIAVKGCGVDLNYYQPSENHRGEHPVTFTFIGRLLYDKGIQEYIRAARIVKEEYPAIRFSIVGEIDRDNPSAIREEDVLRWVKDETVEYHGATQDVRPFIVSSDCIVLPSYREGMSRVIMEAMAMERPVITTDTAGCREAVEHGRNGYLVPVGDPESLAKAMISFAQLPQAERWQMGKQGRAMAEEMFDENEIAEKIYQIIHASLPVKE